MKKLFSGILVLLLAVAMYADSKDCVDGVIEVADSGKFPSGHFGQAAGYLPGDSVFVTNPESGVTLQFLNLGTLDSADGIVILLSDESAKTLGIKKGSGMRCKLNMRYGGFDETVTGQAVIDAEDAALAKKSEKKNVAKAAAEVPAPVIEPAPAVAAVAPVAPAPVVPVAGVPLFENDENPAESDNADEIIEEIAEEPAPVEEEPEEIAEEVSVEPEPVAEEVVAEPVAEEVIAEPVAEEDIPAEPVAEEVVAAPAEETVAEEAVSEEPIEDYENEDAAFAETREAVEQPSPAEVAEAEELAAVEEPVAEEVITEPVAEESIEEVAEEETVAAVAEPVEEEEEVPVPSEAVEAEELPAIAEETRAVETETVEEVPAVEEVEEVEEITDEPAVEETVAEEAVEDDYVPIVLVPAEPVAPEATEEVVEETRAAEPVAEEAVEVVAEAPAVEAEPLAEPEPVAEPEVVPEAKPVEFTSYKDLIVESESMLKKGCWYVQIASLGNAENLEKTVRKYSKYPMILIPNGKGAYRVLVGPLGMDEYAAVLAKFKAFGYKDAFLKKK
ncbi:MAG: SPOR domain-containing protein [Spirochaetales bacterium]|nr:SPOR domain-containing protein [Spirochaetales bacterium]